MKSLAPKRRRGVILTAKGFKKLQDTKHNMEIWSNDGDRYTLEELSGLTGLAPITIAKVLNGDTGVDRQTLFYLFRAFHLNLEDDDFTNQANIKSEDSMQCAQNQERVPEGWMLVGSHPQDYAVYRNGTTDPQGKTGILMQSIVATPAGFGTLVQTISASRYLGMRLRLSANLKTEAATWAGLWMRIDGDMGRVLGFDNMHNRPVRGTTDWARYAVVLDIPPTSMHIAFGVLLGGEGRVWTSNFQVESVSPEVQSTNMNMINVLLEEPVNLDFSLS